MNEKISQDIKNQIKTIIEEENHILYDINFIYEDGEEIMQIQMMNKTTPLNMDECTRMTKLISPILEENFIYDDYRVEIGSAGLKRSIKDKAQWNLSIDELVKIKLEDTSIKAKLIQVNENSIDIFKSNKTINILFKDIIKAKTIIAQDFKN